MREETVEYLKSLKLFDRADEKFDEEIVEGDYNRIDFSDAEGKRLVVKTQFTNYLDLSGGEFGEVVLVGMFNVVDASDAKIEVLDRRKAEIWDLDVSGAKIKRTQK